MSLVLEKPEFVITEFNRVARSLIICVTVGSAHKRSRNQAVLLTVTVSMESYRLFSITAIKP